MMSREFGAASHASSIEVERVCDQFERQWLSGDRPEIESFLTSVEPDQRWELLVELISIELEWTWRSQSDGDPARLEDYLQRFSDLADPIATSAERRLAENQCILELIGAEYFTRHMWGDQPSREEYQLRFGHLGAPLDQRLDEAERALLTSSRKQDGGNDGGATGSTVHSRMAKTLYVDRAAQLSGDDLRPDQKIGRYLIQGLLGKGGFGTVYLAADGELDRQVAVKVPNPDQFDSTEVIERFIREMRIVAKLKHPGIVPVFDAGLVKDGRPFVVMEFVAGQSLTDLLAAKPLTAADAARLMSEVAEAVAYAHKQGLVHRDLKPANVLLDPTGKPLVTDFGLAVEESDQRGRAGELAGTLAYMAPEQVRGDVHRLDGRADIWALGVTLYEMLTGRLPFGGDTVAELSDEIQHRELKPPRQIDEEIPKELERIIFKCCTKDINARYSTATDLANDLRNYSETDESISAISRQAEAEVSEPVTVGSQIGFRWPAIALATVALVVCAILFLPSWFNRQDDNQQGVAKSQPVNATAAKPLVKTLLHGTLDVRIWSEQNDDRKGLSLHDQFARPLQNGDGVRIEADLPKPAYVYILWIDSVGKVQPVYPWQPGIWGSRPAKEKPIQQLRLPQASDEAWPVEGRAGMETLVMLVRDSSLDPDFDLREHLQTLPRQAAQHSASLVEFVNGQAITQRDNPRRGLKLFDPRKIDDPVIRVQKTIKEQLGEHFRYIHAISFANGGPP